jgi:hypothetical protein
MEALQILKQKLSRRKTILIYKVPENILRNQITSRIPCSNTRPAVQNFVRIYLELSLKLSLIYY